MSQDDEEDIPVTEREMNLKVTIYPSAMLALVNFSDQEEAVNQIFLKKMLKLILLGSHIKLGPGYVQRSPSKGQ